MNSEHHPVFSVKMRKFAGFAGILLSFCLQCRGQDTLPPSVMRVFDIDKSLFYAERNRKEVLLAEQSIALAEELSREAVSHKFPKIDLLLNYSHFDPNNLPMVLPPSFGSMFLPGNSKTRDYYYLGRVSLWWDLYAGGRYNSSIVLADSNRKTAENQVLIVKNDIDLETRKAFYNLLATEDKIKYYEIFLSSIQSAVMAVEPNKRKGADWLGIVETISGLEYELRLLRKDYEQYRLDYLDTLGLELNTIFSITGSLTPVIREYNLNELLALSSNYRAEPKQVLIQEKIDDLSLKLSLIARHPTVSLGAHYEFGNDDARYILKEKGWITALNIDLPVFEGLVYWIRIRQQRLQIQQNKYKRREIDDSIRLEVRKAYNDYLFWIVELSARETEHKNYSSLFETADRKDTIETVHVYRQYLKSRMNLIDTIYHNLASHAELEHAVGKALVAE